MLKTTMALIGFALVTSPALAQSYGQKDIETIKSAYQANQLRFKRDYVGKAFDATIPLHTLSENSFLAGKFNASFGTDLLGEVECKVEAQADLDLLIEKSKGDPIHITGLIDDVGFGSIELARCTFK